MSSNATSQPCLVKAAEAAFDRIERAMGRYHLDDVAERLMDEVLDGPRRVDATIVLNAVSAAIEGERTKGAARAAANRVLDGLTSGGSTPTVN